MTWRARMINGCLGVSTSAAAESLACHIRSFHYAVCVAPRALTGFPQEMWHSQPEYAYDLSVFLAMKSKL